MTIKNTNTTEKGNFKAIENNLQAGILTYIWDGENKIIIEHTVVAPLFEGKGIGRQLVMAAVEFAREKGVKIEPICPFAMAVFEKKKDIQDVLAYPFQDN